MEMPERTRGQDLKVFVELRLPSAGSWTPQESQVERQEHQNDSKVHRQPFPESVSEEHQVYTDYDSCHRHYVKHGGYRSAHFSSSFNRNETCSPMAN
jgi:hypothetical protein